jgi:hypothetical protein
MRLRVAEKHLPKLYRLWDKCPNDRPTQQHRLKMWNYIASIFPNANIKGSVWGIQQVSLWEVYIVENPPTPGQPG